MVQMMEVDTIESYKQKYPDEWVVVEVLEEDDEGNVKNARLLGHSRNKENIDNISSSFKGYTYSFFNGDIPEKGHIFAL